MKINDLIKEINKDAWDQSEWCYVKLQTLLETVVNKFLAGKRIESTEKGLKAKLDKIENVIDFDLNIFHKLNDKANGVKHNAGVITVYDKTFLKKYAGKYNDFVQKFLPISTQYIIDSSIFSDGSLTVNSKNDSQDTTPEVHVPNIKYEMLIKTGTSEQDYGFQIHCTKGIGELDEYERCIYATIYNFLQRSNVIENNRFICEYENEQGHTIDYAKVFRYEMMLLTLVRFNCADSGNLQLDSPIEEQANIKIACDNINHYAKCLSILCKKEHPKLKVNFNRNGIRFSIQKREKSNNDRYCYITEQTERSDDKRDIWFAPNLVYSVDSEPNNEQTQVLTEFLSDFFGYNSFRNGQLEAIARMLSTKNRSVCIMPTGAGKSIVYYMTALLSACPTIVISPTKALAKDQQRNLKKLHNIDDCEIFFCDNNGAFKLTNRMIFLTPEDLQRYDVIRNVIEYNTKGEIANVVLDEIHTLCNWSHDFRPDYLMLCHNLFAFVDRCRYLGFTATANYKVLNDITSQLKISNKDVIQPIVFDAGNFEFNYIKCKNENQQTLELLKVIETFISLRERPDDRMIVFTHNVTESNNLQAALTKLHNYDTDCFDAEHTYSYQEFLSGKKHVLIADSEMGIGINLPNIVHAVHYGLPNSKAQYSQEIGRANRTLNAGNSTVIFVGEDYLSSDESRLISFDTSIDEIINIVKILDTDLSRACQSILGSTKNYNISASHIVTIYNSLIDVENYKTLVFRKDNKNSKNDIQKYLYKLYLIGIVDNWYIRDEDNDNLRIHVEVDFKKDNIDHIKEKTIGYLNSMGRYNKYTNEIKMAETVEKVIYCFEEWFYNEFLRYHIEQLLNVVEFFNYYAGIDNRDRIKQELQNYFTITLKAIDSKREYIEEISQEELISSRMTVSSDMNNIAEELLNQEYNQKYDLICYLYNMQKGNTDSIPRLLRIIDNSTEVERRNLLEYMYIYYESMRTQDKIAIISKLTNYFSERAIIDSIYRRSPEDEVYYGYLAQNVNSAFL